MSLRVVKEVVKALSKVMEVLKVLNPDAAGGFRCRTRIAGSRNSFVVRCVDGFDLDYRGTSLIRNSALQGPYSRTMHRALWWVLGGGRFLMSEVPLYVLTSLTYPMRPPPCSRLVAR